MMSVKYPEIQRIIDCLCDEIAIVCSNSVLREIFSEVKITGYMESQELSVSMQSILERLENAAGHETAGIILHNTKHALTSDNYQWARTLYMQHKNIDALADAVWNNQMVLLKKCLDNNQLFFDQPIDARAYDYARSKPELFYGRRVGNKIIAMAIPYRLVDYLNTNDTTKKRYYMCHCPFARESILQEKTVSNTMCHCSMGHVKLFWETALNLELKGAVIKSALAGDEVCIFEFYLPDSLLT